MGKKIKFITKILSLGEVRQRILILVYHRVLPHKDPLWDGDVDQSTFAMHMKVLKEGFNVLPVSEAIVRLNNGTLPPRCVCITFDDGYADNYEVALPILKNMKLPASFFIAVGYLDGGRMWNDTIIESVRVASGDRLNLQSIGLGIFDTSTVDKRSVTIYKILEKLKYHPIQQRNIKAEQVASIVGAPLPGNIMMTTEQVQQLHSAGMEIGAHTVNHPILTKISNDSAKDEIVTSKNKLEEIIGDKIQAFAFPNGKPNKDYNAEHVVMVRNAGFKYCVSTSWGTVRKGDDLYQLPRISPWEETSFRFAISLMKRRYSGKAETV